MLENREIGGALAIDMHDIVLDGIGVAHGADIAQQHRHPIHHPDGNVLAFLHRLRAGIQRHIIFMAAEPRRAGRHDHIGILQRSEHGALPTAPWR